VNRVPLNELLELADSGVWGDEGPVQGVSVLRSTNFNGDGTIDFSKLAYRNVEERKRPSKLLAAGDILLEKSGGGPAQPVGRVCLFRGDSRPHTFGNFIARLRPTEAVLSEYLFFYLWYLHAIGLTSHYQKQTTGIRNLEFKRYLGIDVPLVSLSEQRRIVDLLSRAEGIVRLRREAQKKAQEIIPALFLDMFGDPATNPKGWPIEKFGAVGTLDRGKSRHRPRDAQELYGGPYPFIQTGDVANSNGRIQSYSATYSELGLAQSRLWPKGTLCITIAANIANTATLEFDACFPDSVVGFLPRHGVRTQYVQAWLSFLRPMLEATAPQAAQKNINLEILRNLPIPVPSTYLQEQFESRCSAVVAIQAQQESASKNSNATFSALLSQAFT
jgi:type I restriction enzyme S subunit